MPLLLVPMPLTVLSVAPGVELNLGNSLIPITGIVLLLRSMLEGNYWQALQFAAPVGAVTLACCLLAVRWAVEQFNSESVLFREGERLDVGLWVRHLLRDRQPTPTVAGALFCGMVILVIRFFLGVSLRIPENFQQFAATAVVTQLAVILTPALLMTVMLTSSPRQTLLLCVPAWWALPAAVVLAVAMHPAVIWLQGVVSQLYPVSPEMKELMQRFLSGSEDFGLLLLVVAVIPAVCEELAFRGFILSGFRHLGHKWRAIVYSALLFGLAHSILQQSLVASLVGIVIGILAVQTGSLWPCILFHMVHNGLALATSRLADVLARWPVLRPLVVDCEGDMIQYSPWLILGAGVVAAAILFSLLRLRCRESAEEELQDAIRLRSHVPS